MPALLGGYTSRLHHVSDVATNAASNELAMLRLKMVLVCMHASNPVVWLALITHTLNAHMVAALQTQPQRRLIHQAAHQSTSSPRPLLLLNQVRLRAVCFQEERFREEQRLNSRHLRARSHGCTDATPTTYMQECAYLAFLPVLANALLLPCTAHLGLVSVPIVTQTKHRINQSVHVCLAQHCSGRLCSVTSVVRLMHAGQVRCTRNNPGHQ